MKKIEILIVEDSLTQAEELKFILENNSMNVTHALNAEHAIGILDALVPDIIVSDIVMPGMDGYQFCSSIKSKVRLKDIPFILLTSLADGKAVIKGLECGADSFLTKPFNEELLLTRIHYFLKNVELRKNQTDNTIPEILFANEKFTINSTPKQILDILLSTFEDSILKNKELNESNKNLKQAQSKLFRLNASLEQIIKLRTQELENTNKKLVEEIEERKRIDQVLIEKAELLSNAEKLSHIGSWRFDLINGSVIWSDEMYSIFGIDKDSNTHNILDLFNTAIFPDDTDKVMEVMKNIQNEGTPIPMNYRIVRPNGELRWVHVEGKPIADKNGKTIEQLGTLQDITERKKAENALLESHEMLNKLAEQVPGVIYQYRLYPDGHSCFPYSSSGIMDIYEVTPEQVIEDATPVFGRLHPEDLDFIVRTINESARSLEFYHVEFRVILPTKGIQWRLCDAKPERMPDGSTLWYGIITDISERKKTEQELLEINDLNRSLIQTIPFGIDIVDEEGNILFMSENFINTFGPDAIGRKCWSLYCDNKSQCTDCPLFSGVTIGKTALSESSGIMDGRTFQISHTGMLYKGKKAMLEIFQDITNRKQNEIELKNAKEKAEESDRLKSAFLANMSHELRTPLNGIIGFSELLIDPDISAETQYEFAHLINSSGATLLSIISDIMDLSKIEAGQFDIRKSNFELNELMDNLYNEFILKAKKEGLGLIYSPNIAESSVLVYSDEFKVKRILSILIDNAIKFTKVGSVEIGFHLIDTTIKFYVKDTGIGIAQENFKKIFQRFWQIESSLTREYGGNGLGLAISKKLVEVLDGHIWLISEIDKGTTFYFSIPMADSI